eukprot:Rmarinus@m.14677
MKILLCIDDTDASVFAFDWIAANMLGAEDRLFVLTVAELELGNDEWVPYVESHSYAEETWKHIQKQFQGHTIPYEIERINKSGEGVCYSILETIRQTKAEIVVIGNRELDALGRFMAGSVSEDLVHCAHIPVLVCRAPQKSLQPGEHRHVALALDNSKESHFAFDWANRNFLLSSDRVTLLTVPHDMGSETISEAGSVLAKFKERCESQFFHRGTETIECSTGKVSETIVEYVNSNKVDVLVMGARDLGAVKRLFMTSVCDEALHSVHCPVLVCKMPNPS